VATDRRPEPGAARWNEWSRRKDALTGVLAFGLSLGAAAGAFAQTDLGSGQIRIIGTGLDITPQAQTVPPSGEDRESKESFLPVGLKNRVLATLYR